MTLRVFKHGELVEQAVRTCAEQIGRANWQAMLELLRLSDEVITELLYISDFAEENLYFRRIRIPPLLVVYWNNIFINSSVRGILRHFVRDHDVAVREGHQALRKIERMKELAKEADLPVEDIEYMWSTFRILALARDYFLLDDNEETRQRLLDAKEEYRLRYPRGSRYRYRVSIAFSRFRVSPGFLLWLLRLSARKRPGYRIIDQVLVLHLLSFIYRFIRKRRPHWIPEFARESAMGIDTIFR